MKNNKKSLTVIIIILLVATFNLMYNNVTITSILTDSGFDSSYGGGHSHSSGSSHSRSRSSSSSRSSRTTRTTRKSNSNRSSTSYSGKNNSLKNVISTVIVTFVSLIIICSIMFRGTKRRTKYVPMLRLNKRKAWNSDMFATMIKDITLEKFLFERVADLVQVQYNWMNFDYDKLREKLTDELYNQYEMQLKTLQNKGQRNVMKDFNTIDSMVTNVENNNGRYTVTMEVIISFIDYIEQNGKAVRGRDDEPITMHYELVYTSSSNGIVSKCPKCGGELSDTTSQECPYCRTQIVQDSTKWVMSKKIAKNQM